MKRYTIEAPRGFRNEVSVRAHPTLAEARAYCESTLSLPAERQAYLISRSAIVAQYGAHMVPAGSYWHATGPVRGACGHRHRSPEAAQACAMRDHRACHSLGGGAYSDRRVVRVDP